MPAAPNQCWEATAPQKAQSKLQQFMNWLAANKGLNFADYKELWNWSTTDINGFWKAFAEYSGVIDLSTCRSVLNRPSPTDFIGTRWFEGVVLNYAEVIFRNADRSKPALIFRNERMQESVQFSWPDVEKQTAALAQWMRTQGIGPGDRVASVLPNIPEALIGFLATQSLGAIWSSCSPDFGNASITDRFRQIEPKLILLCDGYSYNGKQFDKTAQWLALCETLPSLKNKVFVSYMNAESHMEGAVHWNSIQETEAVPLQFQQLSFDAPLWILFSSGTTGIPKAITHSVGGNLIEHLKVLWLHWDVKQGDRFFWFTTTGWMMWNFAVGALLAGSTLVLYDGSPAYPDLNTLWNFARQESIQHFGVGAAFITSCMKAGLSFSETDFPALKTIGSTGSPLPPEAYDWIYTHVKRDLWLISFSGGTDICSGFVGGSVLLPVYRGEIQCRLLGVALEAFDEEGKPVYDETGEMVITQPMPSMPLFFWKDKDNERYRASYFDTYPGIWRHGDFITITSRGSLVISGRSDATLNRDGVRIGTSEIYSVLDAIDEINDSLVVCAEKTDGSFYMPLYVQLKQGTLLSDELKKKINSALRTQCSPRHVPDVILAVPGIPYTISGKKMETPVKKMLQGAALEKVASRDAAREPELLEYFARLARSGEV